MDPIVYLDHATSWPKPPEVFEAMRKAMEEAAQIRDVGVTGWR